MNKAELIFYSREKCPLCMKAKEILADLQKELDFSIREVDIYSSDELIELYGLMIPVVEYQGEIIQYGQIDKTLVRKRLQENI